jgi:MFS transporter, FHS family, L-fucose permease
MIGPTMKVATKRDDGNVKVFAAASGLFAIWGMAFWLYNALFSKFAVFFSLTSGEQAWLISLLNIVYFAMAIPAALCHRRFGYKLGLLFGLCIIGVGAFLLYFAIIQHCFAYFLGAAVMMGTCGAWLDTSLNPMTVEAGSPQTSVWRLNFAQVFGGVGLLAGCITALWLSGAHYQLSSGAATQLSARPYILVGLAAIFLAYLIEQVNFPDFATIRAERSECFRRDIASLAGNRKFLFAAASLCAYSVVMTVIWSANPHYSAVDYPASQALFVMHGYFWFVVGRFIGTAVMRFVDPTRLLQWCIGLSFIAVVMASVLGGMSGWICMLSVSLFLSIVFPTVVGVSLYGLGLQTKLAAGILVTMGGIGSAAAPLFVRPALVSLNVHTVILLALPFLAIMLAYSLTVRPKACR